MITMNQTKSLLSFLANVSTLTLTNDVIRAWHVAISDEDPARILIAARHWAKSSTYPPKPADLIEIAKAFDHVDDSAEIAWSKGPSEYSDGDFAHGVWKAWGGAKRFGSLPDLQWAENHTEAERTISFARKEFIELYNATVEKKKTDQLNLSQSDALKMLEHLNSLGVDTQKLLG